MLRGQEKQEQVVNTDGHTRESTGGGVPVAHSEANGGCTPYKVWKAAGEMAGEASAGVSKDVMALIQDFMMAASQLKAPTTEGGPQTEIPAMSCEYS